jgi:hypothetical protein
MAIVLSTRPAPTSGWVAAKNPVVYKFFREDFTIASADDSGGFLRLQITGDVTATVVAGDSIIVMNTAHSVYYSTTVTTSTFGGGTTQVVTALTYSAARDTDATSGFLNNISRRVNWRIEVEVWTTSTAAPAIYASSAVVYSYRQDLYGIIYVDVTQEVLAQLSAEWSNPSVTDENDYNAHVKFYIKYQEKYDGSAVAQVSDSATYQRAVFAALQIYYLETTQANGADLTAYVPGSTSKSFLNRKHVDSVNSKIRVWSGYPFTITFIWPSAYATLYRRTQQFDAAGASLGTDATALSGASPDYLGRLELQALNASAKTMTLFLSETNVSAALTETITITIEEVCAKPVFLFWKDSLGGDQFHMFAFNQEYTYNLSGGRRAKRMVLYAENLEYVEWEALNELNSPGEIYKPNIRQLSSSIIKTAMRAENQVYILNAAGTSKIGVVVIPKQNSMQTRHLKHNMVIEIELPEVFE